MKLYYSPGACSLAPHLVLQELGLRFEAVPVNLKTKHYSGGDYTQVNPKGAVPALELDNGEVLTEGSVIIQYLADQKPESGLIPKAGTMERYRCQEWLNYISTELHKGLSPLWSDATPDNMKTMIKQMMEKKFTFLSNHLQKNTFLMGNQFTVADDYLFTILSWCAPLKVDLSKWHPLMGFMERLTSRPATQTTLKAEGLLK